MQQTQRTSGKIIFVLALTILFSMYQETAKAQPAKKPRPKKTAAATKTAEVKPAALPDVAYTISMSKPWTHLLEVEMRVKWSPMPEQAEITMPVWTPGSYLVREYARHVQDFAARDAASGRALNWRKKDKNTWQIDAKGSSEFVVAYKVYSNELTVRTNELNDEHAFWNNSALLMYPNGALNAPSTVRVVPFGNWKVATGLPRVEGQENTFRAENFDVRGKPHRWVVTGEGNYDLTKIARDSAKIVEEGAKIFGDLPYDNYLFILNLRGGGGLEHLNSTALQWNKFGFKPESRYTDFLTLVAHEHFHAWNVKRIRPDALGPFDYENENYTRLLWVAEGGTAYYEGLLVQRAGLMTDKQFLASKATQIQALQNRPGRFQTSLEEASFDAWIKYYRQDENSINNQISYYDKGEIVNFLLDVEIRRSSGGAKSLDDVFRHLYNEFYKKNKNYAPEDFQKTAELMAGKSLEDFFARYVRGREEIDYNSILAGVGLQLTTGGGGRESAYLGANLSHGLNAKDQIVAADGYRADQRFLETYLGDKKPGDKIRLTVFRFDELKDIEITLGAQRPQNYKIVAVENPTDAQRALYKAYMGADLK
jgi:predicted metalloprotease with PDZ domain